VAWDGGVNLFGGGLTRWMGLAGVLILVLVLIHLLVRRTGGWRLLRRRVRRELELTAKACSQPVASQVRYRRRLRLLTRELRSPAGWADAERAIGYATTLRPGFEPYGLLLGKDQVGVLVAGEASGGNLPAPWSRDGKEPRLWWIARSDLADYSVAPAFAPAELRDAPLLVCVGTDSTGRAAVLLDLLAGPVTIAVYGVPRTARAVVQAVAAQLDVRLPAGVVEVADGVHRGHPGMSVTEAVSRPGVWFAVGAEPLESALPSGVRLLSLGVARGSSRVIEALPDGTLRVHGAAEWLRVDPSPLPRAVARSVRRLAPYDFEGWMPPDDSVAGDDLDDFGHQVGASGISAVATGEAGANRKVSSWT
jgi:hypothetical protein